MLVSVIGLGTFGAKMATRLAEKHIDVIAIDMDEELVDKIKDNVTQAVCLDVTEERAMRSINISEVDVAVVAIGDNIQTSILAVAMLRKLGVGRVIARATNALHEHVLREVGASEIVKVEEEMGDLVASKITAPHILHRYNFAAGYSLIEVRVGKSFMGKTLVETQIRQHYKLNIVAIHKKVPVITDDGKSSFKIELNDSPLPMDFLHEDDIMVIIGREHNLQEFLDDMDKG